MRLRLEECHEFKTRHDNIVRCCSPGVVHMQTTCKPYPLKKNWTPILDFDCSITLISASSEMSLPVVSASCLWTNSDGLLPNCSSTPCPLDVHFHHNRVYRLRKHKLKSIQFSLSHYCYALCKHMCALCNMSPLHKNFCGFLLDLNISVFPSLHNSSLPSLSLCLHLRVTPVTLLSKCWPCVFTHKCHFSTFPTLFEGKLILSNSFGGFI